MLTFVYANLLLVTLSQHQKKSTAEMLTHRIHQSTSLITVFSYVLFAYNALKNNLWRLFVIFFFAVLFTCRMILFFLLKHTKQKCIDDVKTNHFGKNNQRMWLWAKKPLIPNSKINTNNILICTTYSFIKILK